MQLTVGEDSIIFALWRYKSQIPESIVQVKNKSLLLIFLPIKTEKIQRDWKQQGPVVQSIVSLTSLLVVKMLTVLVSRISNHRYF